MNPARKARTIVILCALSAAALLTGPRISAAQTIRGTLMEFGSDKPIDLGLIIMVSERGDSITSTLSTPTGFFEVSAPEEGNYLLLAAALGYRETQVGLFELGAGGEISVQFRLWPEPLSIDGVVVESLVREPQLVRNGFYRRMQRGSGSFIRPVDLAESTSLRAIEVIQGLPGVRMTIDRTGAERLEVRGTRGFCVPTLFLDGVRVEWANIDMRLEELVPMEALYGIEVHRGVTGIPIEFGSFNQCGVIVFWTRQSRSR
jgi:hypothetical protein